MTFRFVAERLTPLRLSAEKVVVAFKLESEPLLSTSPGALELPSTRVTDRFELNPSAALP